MAPGLAGGALLGVANPKAWIAIAAVFASARLAGGAALDAAAKAAVLTVMIVLINTTWLAAGARSRPPPRSAPRPPGQRRPRRRPRCGCRDDGVPAVTSAQRNNQLT